ncbi:MULTISPECIES: protein translocase subunit SecD [unclassified Nocardioides]|uniref:protein translocase subunit SecD n=1 Tax=unclassified Nocardioides TaxID=2615069 RepID=UPI0006FFB70B|nr:MULTISPECIES: protein translocase subunit SecD [unclassified Nocardioides]KQY57670.1 preprotein translocase subunit SecD [Nocardioides sp. Root140]KRF13207.1 preprotein translocase subunit SecD [Nocardioides sp. Soil796]
MSRGALIRLLLVIGLLAGCVALALNKEPRLGLDLRGGTQIMLQAESTDKVKADAESVDRAIEILRGRVDALGVAEPTLTRVGDDRILVELPDLQDPKRAVAAIGKTAQLSMHPVVAAAASPDAKPTKKGDIVLPDEDNSSVLELGPAALQGSDIEGATPTQAQNAVGWSVSIDFDDRGGKAYGEITGKAACNPSGDPKRRIAIVLDGKIISSPQVNEDIQCNVGITGGKTDITGNFSNKAAKDLSILIEGGALPVPVKIISQSTVGPTLGDAAIDASAEAGIIGLIITGLFIIIVYRLVGALAAIALTSYAVLSYAMLLALGSTLTLPGLAGFVLAIGLAIDANVLVFERAREEYAENPKAGMRRALQIGFNKAWTAIIDSNVTTLLAAALLFLLASGSVKGFGVTLSIGVIASMVSALVIARVLTEIGVSTKAVARRPRITGLANVGRARTWLTKKNPNIMAKGKIWLGISGAALVLALVGIFGHGLNYGLEFTGGRSMEYTTAKPISADTAREIVADAGVPEAVVQIVKGSDDVERVSIRAGDIDDATKAEIEKGLTAEAGKTTQFSDDTVAASLGNELKEKALLAFFIALIAQMIYLAFRFHWTFAVSAVGAMFHDVLIVTGIFAWLDKPIDGIFLASALTIVGLSVNDTVVVFDRIRERWQGTRTGTFAEVSNTACIETMPRTINTGLGAMFILGALAVLGGDSLQDFAIALLLGLIIGTYSSVFSATPALILLQKVAPFSREKKERKVRDAQDSGAVV